MVLKHLSAKRVDFALKDVAEVAPGGGEVEAANAGEEAGVG
jgi:hypothetical protein